MTVPTNVFGRRGLAGAAALALLLALGGCKSVTGRVWLPVYSDLEEAVGRVTVHFTADCVAAGRQEPLVWLRYVDTAEDVRFDAEGQAPVCSSYDTFYGIYGQYSGFYYPELDADMNLDMPARRREGTFRLEIVDGGEPGYSQDDYICFSLERGVYARYRLPKRDDVDGDGRDDEGCSFIGGGVVQLNLGATVPSF